MTFVHVTITGYPFSFWIRKKQQSSQQTYTLRTIENEGETVLLDKVALSPISLYNQLAYFYFKIVEFAASKP